MPLIGRALLIGTLFLTATLSVSGAEPLKWGADAEGGAPFIFLDPDVVALT